MSIASTISPEVLLFITILEILELLKWLMRLSALIWVITYFLIDRLPPSSSIHSELYTAPIQEMIPSETFIINYKGEDTTVKTVADYSIWGVVVSHNDISGFLDISHNEKSIDTKDLCIVWGSNLKNNTYKKLSYSSGDWTCYPAWKEYTPDYRGDELSNNHLITNNEKIRTVIDKVRIGDQIFMKGKLVNYSENRSNGFWRNTSLIRTDQGCEVMFVEELTILDSYNWLPILVQKIASYLFITLLFLRLALVCCFPRESSHTDVNIP